MSHWNGHAYDAPTDAKTFTAKKDIRCVHCGGWIYKGEKYSRWNGYRGYSEHLEGCPTDPQERARRGCATHIGGSK